MRDKDIHPVEV